MQTTSALDWHPLPKTRFCYMPSRLSEIILLLMGARAFSMQDLLTFSSIAGRLHLLRKQHVAVHMPSHDGLPHLGPAHTFLTICSQLLSAAGAAAATAASTAAARRLSLAPVAPALQAHAQCGGGGGA